MSGWKRKKSRHPGRPTARSRKRNKMLGYRFAFLPKTATIDVDALIKKLERDHYEKMRIPAELLERLR